MIPDSVPPAVAIALGIVALAAVLAVLSSLSRIAIRLASAPGVVVHEFAHKQACHLVGVPVTAVAYFRFGEPPGYVRHEQPERYRESFLISVAPFLVNTVVSLLAFLGAAALAASVGIGDAGFSGSALVADLRAASRTELATLGVLGWLGLAVGAQAFPSTGDANSLWSRSRAEWRRSPVVLLGIPVVIVIYVANLLSRLWADVFYALGLAAVAFYAVGAVGF
ncbi:metalloprotease family protein [Haloterrigena alkaliphila]|uniref:DUF3267 domain-containing protein n=1 Tax=Haloterrigena alkaliphila TaxID=2816475 RepID=A0A8A2VE92_9EURY|nr:metalloprotease family protein [Haloterrigena alkaliphila]QSX00370.1 metalloprotease family protein [Haloterrigena alkaliphila]